jgi:hypothetical protein
LNVHFLFMRISALSRALAVFSDFRGRKRISRHRYEGFRDLARMRTPNAKKEAAAS